MNKNPMTPTADTLSVLKDEAFKGKSKVKAVPIVFKRLSL